MKYMMYNLVNNRKARGIKKVGLVRHQQVCLTFHFHVVYRYILHFLSFVILLQVSPCLLVAHKWLQHSPE